MGERELFQQIMGFETRSRSLKWEMGYWGSTLKKWYRQGLPEKKGIQVPKEKTTIASSIHTFLFEHLEKTSQPQVSDGLIVWGNALYWPSQGCPLDIDVRDRFCLDSHERNLGIELFFSPHFEPKILSEEEDAIIYVDIDGIKRRYNKKIRHLPNPFSWPITDEKDWQAIKEERLDPARIAERFPKDWKGLVQKTRQRDHVLSLGGYPLGIFGTLAHFLGFENLFYFLYDMKDLIRDILDTFTDLWIDIWEEALMEVDVDVVHLWEDISVGKSAMLSPYAFKEMIFPYYKKIASFLKAKGVKNILVDTDGDCREVIPLFLEAGITGIYPLEVSSGIDLKMLRRMYPRLQMMGGISRYAIAAGKDKTDEALSDVEDLLKEGGYIPFIENIVTSDINWEHFKYYRGRLNQIIDGQKH